MDPQDASRRARGRPANLLANRSLERGIEILRAFRPGSEILGNSELAERTGLPRSTVSRLTQSLVETGFLQYDAGLRAYRLGVPVLSLAHAMRGGAAVLQVAAPFMRKLAEGEHLNVGLAMADRDEMVYLESIRYSRRASLRSVVAGQRVPMALTSLGRAWLAVAPESDRAALMADFSTRFAHWRTVEAEIRQAIAHVQRHGWCAASWQPEVVAVSTPLQLESHPIHVLNVSLSTKVPFAEAAARLAPLLMRLSSDVRAAFLATQARAG
ncbi:IclR family transcriptional regulator [Cupriavidus sp. UYPR2.512]|uniref:IclR family transcriptional regulator n=1 Tax=Cupriavidus sp. UYPR2.512 TaxID=1080187 RepID=UPI000375E72A|nr:IclR family transcriptional regulator [Cupriavidus sp. UYPR2.512]UIF89945.1 IclR family transcriptional regulator [Cupriavidus necator]